MQGLPAAFGNATICPIVEVVLSDFYSQSFQECLAEGTNRYGGSIAEAGSGESERMDVMLRRTA
jgi:hypothetical protein